MSDGRLSVSVSWFKAEMSYCHFYDPAQRAHMIVLSNCQSLHHVCPPIKVLVKISGSSKMLAIDRDLKFGVSVASNRFSSRFRMIDGLDLDLVFSMVEFIYGKAPLRVHWHLLGTVLDHPDTVFIMFYSVYACTGSVLIRHNYGLLGVSWLSPNYNVLMQIYPLAVLIFPDVIYIGPMSIVVSPCGLMCHILVAVLILVQSCDIFLKS